MGNYLGHWGKSFEKRGERKRGEERRGEGEERGRGGQDHPKTLLAKVS
jgi:hypothetical protein